MTNDDPRDDTSGIARLVERHAACWSVLDMEALIDLWDDEEPDPVYVAHELGDILVGLPEISFHLLRTAGRISSAHVTIPGQWSRRLAPDLGLTVFICRWNFVRADIGTDTVSHSRIAAVCRRRESGWRFIHYMEDSYYIPQERRDPGWGAFPAARPSA
jgi:hypothetical protein